MKSRTIVVWLACLVSSVQAERTQDADMAAPNNKKNENIGMQNQKNDDHPLHQVPQTEASSFVQKLTVEKKVPVELESGEHEQTKNDEDMGDMGTKVTTVAPAAGVATQKTTYKSYVAANGNDGDYDTFAHTIWHKSGRGKPNPWWQLDLGSSAAVGVIRFQNRKGNCASRLFISGKCAWETNTGNYDSASEGANFGISSTPCDNNGCTGNLCGRITRPSTGTDNLYTVTCSGKTGRYVYVILPGDDRVLNFNEMEVFLAAPTYLKIANGGTLNWRPWVGEVELFSDTSCTKTIAIPTDGGWDTPAIECPASGCNLCSGWDDEYGNLQNKGCQLAFDGNAATTWRPRGGNHYEAGTAWITFRLPLGTVVQCVKAANLGSQTGVHTWNGGLRVSASTDAQTWAAMTRDASLSGADENVFAWQQVAAWY